MAEASNLYTELLCFAIFHRFCFRFVLLTGMSKALEVLDNDLVNFAHRVSKLPPQATKLYILESRFLGVVQAGTTKWIMILLARSHRFDILAEWVCVCVCLCREMQLSRSPVGLRQGICPSHAASFFAVSTNQTDSFKKIQQVATPLAQPSWSRSCSNLGPRIPSTQHTLGTVLLFSSRRLGVIPCWSGTIGSFD